MKSFDGYLFAKLDAIGKKSEGPIYYLQQFDYKEIVVIKHARPWQEDPELHKFLNKKVTIEGEITADKIAYSNIKNR